MRVRMKIVFLIDCVAMESGAIFMLKIRRET